MMYSLHSTPFPLSLSLFVKTTSEMIYTVSGGALNCTQSNPTLLLSADNGRTTDVKMVIMWMVPTAVWSVSYWVSQRKKLSPSNITINSKLFSII